MNKHKIISFSLLISVFIFAVLIPLFGYKNSSINSNMFYFINSLLLISTTVFLYRYNFQVFVSTLFFVIFYMSRPLIQLQHQIIPLSFPGISWILPILLYCVIVFTFKKLKTTVSWVHLGKMDRLSKQLTLLIVLLSSIALLIWAFFINKNMTNFQKMLPDSHPILLYLGGILFAVSNSIAEEFFARAVLWDGLKAVFSSIVPTILIQAILFGLFHAHGFPGGLMGIIMVFTWSVFLGIIRHRSKGMFAPFIAHFFADLTIFTIIFCTKL